MGSAPSLNSLEDATHSTGPLGGLCPPRGAVFAFLEVSDGACVSGPIVGSAGAVAAPGRGGRGYGGVDSGTVGSKRVAASQDRIAMT